MSVAGLNHTFLVDTNDEPVKWLRHRDRAIGLDFEHDAMTLWLLANGSPDVADCDDEQFDLLQRLIDIDVVACLPQ
jgi:hypothetical protein